GRVWPASCLSNHNPRMREPTVPRGGCSQKALVVRRCSRDPRGGAKPNPHVSWFRRSRCSRKREPLASDAPDPGSSNRSLFLSTPVPSKPEMNRTRLRSRAFPECKQSLRITRNRSYLDLSEQDFLFPLCHFDPHHARDGHKGGS